MTSFPSLEQRIIHSYISTMPPLVPIAVSLLTDTSQTHVWFFLNSALRTVYNEPALIGLSTTPDQFFEDFSLNKSNPVLHKSMLAVRSTLERLAEVLMEIARNGIEDGTSLRVREGVVPTRRKILDTLTNIGLEITADSNTAVFTCPLYPEALKGLRYLSGRIDTTMDSWNKHGCFRAFWGCRMTDDLTSFARSIYTPLLNEVAPLKKFVESLHQKGYWEYAEDSESVRYDILKNHGDRTLKVCSAEAAKNYWGVSLYHDFRLRQPFGLVVRLPNYSKVLARFDSLPDTACQVILRRTKACNNCGYCTQTDKTHTRPTLAVTVIDPAHGRQALCPLFPFVGYQTTTFDDTMLSEFDTVLNAAELVYGSNGDVA
jgi:hypothetical protein